MASCDIVSVITFLHEHCVGGLSGLMHVHVHVHTCTFDVTETTSQYPSMQSQLYEWVINNSYSCASRVHGFYMIYRIAGKFGEH